MTQFDKFAAAQWRAIQAARADWPAGIGWPVVRLELEQAGRDFWTMRDNRLRRPPKVERARLLRALKHVRGLKQEVIELKLDGEGALIEFERKLENRLAIYEIWSSRYFGGRADVHRELLYMRVMQQWAGPLQGELRFSRADGIAGGPMVRYLTAVLKAVLGDEAPGPAGLAKIVGKEKERRRQTMKVQQFRNNYTSSARNIFKV